MNVRRQHPDTMLGAHNFRDEGDRIVTGGVNYSNKGLLVLHRATHAIVLKQPGHTGWIHVGGQGYYETVYFLCELGTWRILREVEPGREWKRVAAELRALADKHTKGAHVAQPKRKVRSTGAVRAEAARQRAGQRETDFARHAGQEPREEKRAGGSGFGGIDKLTVRITKTSDGQRDYVQIMSADMVTVNVVLIAGSIEVHDGR